MFEAMVRKISFKPRSFLIVAAGTQGDVLPLLALGQRLKSRGNEVSFLAPPLYDKWAEGILGLRFFPLCSSQEYEASLVDFHLLNSRYAPLFMLRHAIPWNATMYSVCKSLSTESKNLTVLVGQRGLLWADSLIRSHLRTPLLRLAIDPPQLWELHTSKMLEWRGVVQRNLIAHFEKAWRDVIANVSVKQRLGRLSQLRGAGLPSVPRIGLYPEWLAPNRQWRFVRKFCFIPPPRMAPYSPAQVEKKSEQQLIVFVAGTHGTLSYWGRRFFEISTAICRKHRYSGLLLGGTGTEPGASNEAKESVRWRQYVPLSDILPYASLVVHHGGIGTAAAAIEHGVPQLVIPRFASQPSNAEWIKRLGVGAIMDDYGYTEKQGADQIRKLLTDSNIKMNLRTYQGRCYCKKTLLHLIQFLECWPNVPKA